MQEKMSKTEREKIKSEEDRINFCANLLEAINYTCLPKRVKAQVDRVKFNFYKKYSNLNGASLITVRKFQFDIFWYKNRWLILLAYFS